MLTIGSAFYRLRKGLLPVYDESEATALSHQAMEELTGSNRLDRIMRKDEVLEPAAEARFREIEAALLDAKPIQYIIGHTRFLGRDFRVTPAVLIPRPETEELVEWIIQKENPGSILDVGTGSGCISISLALGLPETAVTAIDVSEEALKVAGQNAESLNANLQFEHCDFLDPLQREALSKFDLIVSNPPYIPLSEADTLHRNVRDHEPDTALFVPDGDPLLFYRRIAEFGKTHLNTGGSIYCELHQRYATDTAKMFNDLGYAHVEVRNDAFGNARMIRVANPM